MERVDDYTIWHYAKDNGFSIVTRDADFNERGLVYGYPPKIVWIKSGNSSTDYVLGLLKRYHADLLAFEADEGSGCIELY